MTDTDGNYRDATEQYLTKQVMLLVFLVAVMGLALLKYYPKVWVIILAVALLLGVFLIYSSRRGIWLHLYRGLGLLTALGLMSSSLIFIAFEKSKWLMSIPPLHKVYLVFFLLVVSIIGAVAIFTYWVKPLWIGVLANEKDVSFSFDYQQGTYSIISGVSNFKNINKGKYVTPYLVFCAGPSIASAIIGFGEWQYIVVITLATLMLLCGFSMLAYEYYFAYQLISIEKKIKSPLTLKVEG